MVVKTLGNGRYTGLSTDTKPTAASTAVNAIFEETDTSKEFYNSGSAWVGGTPSRYAGVTKVYKIGSTYYADRWDGSLLSASGILETVLQTALDQAGDVRIDSPGTFTFDTIGVTIPTYTRLIMNRATVLSVPASSNGFTAITVGTDPQGNRHSEIHGGRIYKSTASKDWTGIHFKAISQPEGQSWCKVIDSTIYQPDRGIKFETLGNALGAGWMSNFRISNVTIYYPKVGIEFISDDSTNGFKRALFDNVNIQDGSADDMLVGFKDVRWRDLTFDNCNVWDLGGTQKTMTIYPDSSNIRIRGGIIARTDGLFFTNSCNSRSVYVESDEWNSPHYGGVRMQTDGLYVTNGRRIGGYFPSGGWGVTPPASWTPYAAAPADTETPFLSTNLTIGRRFPTITPAAIDTGAGLRCPSLITCREWNPIYKIRYRLNSPSTNRRLFFGWSSSPTIDLTGDDPLNLIQGIGLCSRAADTTLQIAHNDGTGPTNFISTGITINTTIRTFELYAIENEPTNKWKFALYSTPGVLTTISATDVPAPTTGLAPKFQIQTSDAVTKSFDVFGLYLETQ